MAVCIVFARLRLIEAWNVLNLFRDLSANYNATSILLITKLKLFWSSQKKIADRVEF